MWRGGAGGRWSADLTIRPPRPPRPTREIVVAVVVPPPGRPRGRLVACALSTSGMRNPCGRNRLPALPPSAREVTRTAAADEHRRDLRDPGVRPRARERLA